MPAREQGDTTPMWNNDAELRYMIWLDFLTTRKGAVKTMLAEADDVFGFVKGAAQRPSLQVVRNTS